MADTTRHGAGLHARRGTDESVGLAHRFRAVTSGVREGPPSREVGDPSSRSTFTCRPGTGFVATVRPTPLPARAGGASVQISPVGTFDSCARCSRCQALIHMGSAVVSPELLPQHPHALPVTDVASELRVTVGRLERGRGRAASAAVWTQSHLRRASRCPTWRCWRGSSRALWWPCSQRRWRCRSPSVRWQQAIAIAVVLLINTAIGYGTERRAVRSMEALRALRRPQREGAQRRPIRGR